MPTILAVTLRYAATRADGFTHCPIEHTVTVPVAFQTGVAMHPLR